MSDELRVEFKVAVSRRPEPRPKPVPGVKAERVRQDRATRRARNLALAYWIEGLVRSGEVADLAAVARMCEVSRVMISNLMVDMGLALPQQSAVLLQAPLLTARPDKTPSDSNGADY